jgi:transcriptional regulator with XRE-family HTH domain
MPADPHQEFQELCALSTTGELTAEEWVRLTGHLAHCDSCQEAKRQYERLIATTIPALGAESSADEGGEDAPGYWSLEEAEATLMETLRREPVSPLARPVTHPVYRPVSPGWKRVFVFAAAAAILTACSLTGYRIGVHNGGKSNEAAASAGPIASKLQPRPNSSLTATAPARDEKIAPADNQAATLRKQARLDQREIASLNDQLNQVERELADRSADLDRSVEERADLNRKLAEVQSNASSLEARLSLIGKETSEDTQQALALKGQVNDLNKAIDEKDKQIADSRELLDRDRDIRNLIGARNLYIAEIYDVGQSGDTQKPFGRVFYTKDKSLIFYGYDLDQQPGIKKAAAFQAWGGRGADRQHAVSLGLLYKDDANQKRWVLKSNDAKTISQIDAVFVTVEPEGGSTKPSGKPLLFTYLRLDPNHP